MKGTRFGLLALSALLAVGTWVAASTSGAVAQASTRMTVTLQEFEIIPELMQVPAGDVTFDVVNTGEDKHELVVIKSDLDVKALPPSSVKGEVDEQAVGEYIGSFEDVASDGGMATGTLVLAPGRYILLCNLTDHYAKGMVTTLQVN
jgi:uncharacterized cupredoxin-like copper-binding protein